MPFFKTFSAIALLASTALAGLTIANDDQDMSNLVVNGIPYSARVKYMRLVTLFLHHLRYSY